MLGVYQDCPSPMLGMAKPLPSSVFYFSSQIYQCKSRFLAIPSSTIPADMYVAKNRTHRTHDEMMKYSCFFLNSTHDLFTHCCLVYPYSSGFPRMLFRQNLRKISSFVSLTVHSSGQNSQRSFRSVALQFYGGRRLAGKSSFRGSFRTSTTLQKLFRHTHRSWNLLK